MKLNKKAILMPETLKIIIAVVCIFLLVYLAVLLYGMLIKKTALEQAKETLKQITAEINSLEEGGEGSFLITSPKNWFIISFEEGESSPKQCKGKNCLCICGGKEIKSCDDMGICKITEKEINILEFSGTLQYDTVNYLKLDRSAIDLYFRLEDGIIKFNFNKNALENNDKELFYNFLSSKSEFLDKGEIEIEEQIRIFFNSNLIPALRDSSDEKKALVNNVQGYFKDYRYPIYVYLVQGKGYTDVTFKNPILKVAGGKDRDVGENEEIPGWPILVVNNPGGEYVKSFVIAFQLRG